MWMAAPSGSAIRSAPAAIASCCILVNAMRRLGVKQGIATECIGGGQGGAMLIETV